MSNFKKSSLAVPKKNDQGISPRLSPKVSPRASLRPTSKNGNATISGRISSARPKSSRPKLLNEETKSDVCNKSIIKVLNELKIEKLII